MRRDLLPTRKSGPEPLRFKIHLIAPNPRSKTCSELEPVRRVCACRIKAAIWVGVRRNKGGFPQRLVVCRERLKR